MNDKEKVILLNKQISDHRILCSHKRGQQMARYKAFLDRLLPLIRDAQDALNCEPPILRVTEQRLDIITERINEELKG